jgi:hypothetical protein
MVAMSVLRVGLNNGMKNVSDDCFVGDDVGDDDVVEAGEAGIN